MVAAPGRISAVNAYDYRNPHLIQFRMTVERGAIAATIGINLFLLHQLNSAAVKYPYQGNMQFLSYIGNPEDIVCLSRNPGASHNFIIGSDYNRPFTGDFTQTVNNSGIAFFVSHRIIYGVQRAPGAGVYQVLKTLPGSHLAFTVHGFSSLAGIFHPVRLLGYLGFHLFYLFDVLLQFPAKSFAHFGHLFEIRMH